ncbi:MAG: AzlD domain-containing protein [Rhodococcus sp. (in: high G+C Gram-positive bacteria)]|uniref:branched-chain amino acid transporter permease n=1 Tax=Rhodococcus sp. TaxID=1831 RepID=UPI003BB528BD
MPDSVPGAGYVLASLLVMFAVTVGLRAAPFAALAFLRDSAVVKFLGTTMPAGVMVILVMYTLRDTGASTWLPAVIGLGVTVTVHLWRRNPALSTVAGTASYVVAGALWG